MVPTLNIFMFLVCVYHKGAAQMEEFDVCGILMCGKLSGDSSVYKRLLYDIPRIFIIVRLLDSQILTFVFLPSWTHGVDLRT